MGSTFVPLLASGVVAPVVLVEMLTASGKGYYWSEQQFMADSVILGGTLNIVSIASTDETNINNLRGGPVGGGGGTNEWLTFTVTLTSPASLAIGTQVTISDNSNVVFNRTWTISAVLTPTTFKVSYPSTVNNIGNGGMIARPMVLYRDWLLGTSYKLTGTVATDTASIRVQNISGNTVTRDIGAAFVADEFIGALVYCRIWRGDAEVALFAFQGNVVGAQVDGQQMTLDLEGFGNWSAIPAPAFNIDVSCGLYFGSGACGSVAVVPCGHTYGTCSSIERFQGVIVEWITISPNNQIAQPAPAVFYNSRRPI